MRLVDRVCAEVEVWQPRVRTGWKERDYSDELKSHLVHGSRLGHNVAVSRSVALPNGRIDLRVVAGANRSDGSGTSIIVQTSQRQGEETVLVELKRNLSRRAHFTRLVEEQIPKYCEDLSDVGRLIIVLVGRTSPRFLTELRRIEEESRRDDRWARNSRQIRVVERPFV